MLFLPQRLLCTALAEVLCLGSRLLPERLALWTLGLCLRLAPHHELAALERAVLLQRRAERGAAMVDDAWAAFLDAVEQLANRGDTSASDLYLERALGRFLRRLGSRLLWGRLDDAAALARHHDRLLIEGHQRLAAAHFVTRLGLSDLDGAERALVHWRSLVGQRDDDGTLRRAAAELAWARGAMDEAAEHLAPWVEGGGFPSPFDALTWAERFLGLSTSTTDWDALDLGERCLVWARQWLPELAVTWRLWATVAERRGHTEDAERYWGRALALDPQDVSAAVARISSRRGWPAVEAPCGQLNLDIPDVLAWGETGRGAVHLTEFSETGDLELHLMPSAGWGLTAGDVTGFDGATADGRRATFALTAHRPDRVRGEPWPLVALAMGPAGYWVARATVSVDDPRPGEALLVVTEDHEIHEERGILAPEMLERLLVEKSKFAADLARRLGVPWTHMVEVGSSLAMTDWAADGYDAEDGHGEHWGSLRDGVRRHLAEELVSGNDLQPHLHTFNDPAYGHFPYAVDARGWHPSARFLLTDAESRGDWASVCPGPGCRTPDAFDPPILDRLASVERAVAQVEHMAQVERVARRQRPPKPLTWRPVLWRSGLLDYGDDDDARAWSTVALRRAGLLAASDLPKPPSPSARAVPAAFYADWGKPFEPRPGGPLLQLPIVANVEGDYRMGVRRLARRAAACLGAVRDRPGIHLFTLLTHDKFINARRRLDEFRLDDSYGDWPVIRRHLEAWISGGARPVTAFEGVRAVVDDTTWSMRGLLVDERLDDTSAHYRLELFGRGIPCSEDTPQQVLVPLPCSLRSRVLGIQVTQGPRQVAVEREGHTAFWVTLVDRSALDCRLELSPLELGSAP